MNLQTLADRRARCCLPRAPAMPATRCESVAEQARPASAARSSTAGSSAVPGLQLLRSTPPHHGVPAEVGRNVHTASCGADWPTAAVPSQSSRDSSHFFSAALRASRVCPYARQAVAARAVRGRLRRAVLIQSWCGSVGDPVAQSRALRLIPISCQSCAGVPPREQGRGSPRTGRQTLSRTAWCPVALPLRPRTRRPLPNRTSLPAARATTHPLQR
jgi:hypothetical protein